LLWWRPLLSSHAALSAVETAYGVPQLLVLLLLCIRCVCCCRFQSRHGFPPDFSCRWPFHSSYDEALASAWWLRYCLIPLNLRPRVADAGCRSNPVRMAAILVAPCIAFRTMCRKSSVVVQRWTPIARAGEPSILLSPPL
jgi:hypothetical protein